MQYGVHHIGYLRAVGVDAPAAVRSGALRRIRRGWYAGANASDQELRAAIACGSLTCITLLAEAGAFRPPDPRLHLAITSSSRPRAATQPEDVVTHWSHRISEAPYRSIRTTREEAVGHVLTCQRIELAVAVIDSCLRLRLISPTALADVLSRLPRRLSCVARLTDPRAGSGPESVTRVGLTLAGIECESQVEIPGVGRVDLVIDDWAIIEVDGRQWHDDATSFERDRHRDRAAAALGYTTIRLTYSDVMHHWPATLASIRAVLERGRPR
ncbi:DUF559 domain-containing protein [Rathayibacter tritici]|uniref:DUF559 domain-containing protein n=1 Tax=Rathayibacter tritici TaxID=33888 RepID=A0A160KU56_9MICO|nr:DUF559 domain-containing protein [Rathayibacter tritici]AND17097.1 hypothetical protein A6122_1972 [Rathayibacter tritici]PPF31088.1 DUF559 domain-containing protein [Rathayibacter tritici]PPF70766.1 DUF559 domain-containing protein [Rathayibacter tritici]PPG08774.1 DUF559 domain-containing protein [Rathayibacter tritici]PPI14923.1 DUF559 domain-containing protein [Rathayibacter tritici]